MRDCRTCKGDQTCHAGIVALDASHVIYLARGALALVDNHEEAGRTLVEALRATACWEVGRVWTTAMILDDQIDPQLGRLGLQLPSDPAWSDYLSPFSVNTTVSMDPGNRSGRHDADLLAHVAENASRQPTLLVTNDEHLLAAARRQFFNGAVGALFSANSTSMMLTLLHCGAISDRFVEACLNAEYYNVAEMRAHGMSDQKYEHKRRRLRQAGQQLALHRYDDEWSPDLSS